MLHQEIRYLHPVNLDDWIQCQRASHCLHQPIGEENTGNTDPFLTTKLYEYCGHALKTRINAMTRELNHLTQKLIPQTIATQFKQWFCSYLCTQTHTQTEARLQFWSLSRGKHRNKEWTDFGLSWPEQQAVNQTFSYTMLPITRKRKRNHI